MSAPRNRTAVLLGILAVALVILGHHTPVPETIKAVAGTAAILVLPGWALATAWPRLRDQGIAVHLGLSVPLSLVLVCSLVLAEFLVDLRLMHMAALLLLGTFVLAMMGHKLDDPPRPKSRLPVVFWVAALVMVGLCWWGGGPLAAVSDGPDHLSTVREIVKTEELFPNQGLVPPETVDRNDPRKGVLHIGLALVAVAGNVDPTVVWRVLPAILALFVLAMVYALGKSVFHHSGTALAGAVLTLLCLGGEGGRWVLHLGYGAHMGLWMAWGALWGLFRFQHDSHRGWLVLVALLLSGAEAVHPLAPLFFFLPAGVMWILEAAGGRPSPRLIGALAASLAATLPVVLLRLREVSGPINPLHEVVSPTLFWTESLSTLWPGMILQQLGWLGVAGIVLTFVLRRRLASGWERSFLLAATLGPLAVTLVPGVFDLATRTTSSFPIKSLFLVPAFLVVGRALFLGRTWRVVVALLALAAVVEAVPAFAPRPDPVRTPGLKASLEALRAMDPPRTVIADPWTSYLIAAETGHYPVTVVGQHGHPLDVRGPARLREIATVLSPGCSREEIQRVVDFYAAPLAVIPPGESPALVGYGASRGDGIDAARRRHLLAIGAEEVGPGIYALPETVTADGSEWAGAAVFEPPGAAVEDAGGLVRVESAEAAAPGEEFPVVLWWTRPTLQGALPLEVHLRLEGEGFDPRGWKPARKIREALGRAPRSRLRIIHRPLDYTRPQSCLPPAGAVPDTVRWVLPRDLPAGSYTLSVKVLEQDLMARVSLRDILQEEDRWTGPPVGRVEVREGLTRP